MVLGVNFIGISYLLVYVGAVSILFIFILMLINIRISEITNSSSNSIPLAIFVGSLFLPIIYKTLPLTNNIYMESNLKKMHINNLDCYSSKNINLNSFFKPTNELSYIYKEYKPINNE